MSNHHQTQPGAKAPLSDEGWQEWGYYTSLGDAEALSEEALALLPVSRMRWVSLYRERVETGEIEIDLHPREV